MTDSQNKNGATIPDKKKIKAFDVIFYGFVFVIAAVFIMMYVVPTSFDNTATENQPTVVAIGLSSCINCKLLVPELKEAQKKYSGINFQYFDGNKTDEGKQYVREYSITGVPVLLFFDKNGEYLGKSTGYTKGIVESKLEYYQLK